MNIADIEKNLIMLFEYGSTAQGTNNEDSDLDLMGIVVEPKNQVIGLTQWEQVQIKTALPGQRSGADDTDKTIYSLRKWARLAARGNPTVLAALFVPEYEILTHLGEALLENRELFISKEAGHRHLGYMRSQREAMTGMRNKRTNRPELVHKFGYDSKFAGHMIRLGIQGFELMNSGKITMPMPEAQTILDIRAGKMTKEEVLELSEHIESALVKEIELSGLPEKTDPAKLDELLINLHEMAWEHGNH